MEGVAAGVLMIVTAYLVVSTTTVFTPQDVHITDMQLEQMGNDALAMMDTPNTMAADGTPGTSDLENYIFDNNSSGFNQAFLGYVNGTTGASKGNFKYNASVFYRNDPAGEINSYYFGDISTGASIYYREHAVKVSRLVYLSDYSPALGSDMRSGSQTRLLEVLLWRD